MLLQTEEDTSRNSGRFIHKKPLTFWANARLESETGKNDYIWLLNQCFLLDKSAAFFLWNFFFIHCIGISCWWMVMNILIYLMIFSQCCITLGSGGTSRLFSSFTLITCTIFLVFSCVYSLPNQQHILGFHFGPSPYFSSTLNLGFWWWIVT